MSTKAKLIILITLCSVITLITLYMDTKVMLVWLKKYSTLGLKAKTILSNDINLSVKNI